MLDGEDEDAVEEEEDQHSFPPSPPLPSTRVFNATSLVPRRLLRFLLSVLILFFSLCFMERRQAAVSLRASVFRSGYWLGLAKAAFFGAGPRSGMLQRCFGLCGGGCDGGGGDGLMWTTDLKRHASGDFSLAVVQANSALEDQGQVVTSRLGTYVGVFDGHGGPEASRFVNNKLLFHLHKLASEQGGMSPEVLKRAIDATEEEFLQYVKGSWHARPAMAAVGSCCLVGAISDDVLYIANLGDSRVVLGRKVSDGTGKSVVAERLSTDHNVSEEEIRKELVARHPDDSHIVVLTQGVWRIKGIIQVSRSIGDVYLKKPELSRDPIFQHFVCPIYLKRPVITADPSIKMHKLTPHDMFLIFASDGLWEQLSDQTAVDIVAQNPRVGIAKRLVRAALNEAAKKKDIKYEDITKLEKGVRRSYHDDIIVIVIYLDGQVSRYQENQLDCTRSPADIYSPNSDE